MCVVLCWTRPQYFTFKFYQFGWDLICDSSDIFAFCFLRSELCIHYIFQSRCSRRKLMSSALRRTVPSSPGTRCSECCTKGGIISRCAAVKVWTHSYSGADKSLARPGRKQANVSVRMAWISFGVLPCRKKILTTARVSMLLKSRASLTCFRACFLPGRAKDLSAPRQIIRVGFTFSWSLVLQIVPFFSPFLFAKRHFLYMHVQFLQLQSLTDLQVHCFI